MIDFTQLDTKYITAFNTPCCKATVCDDKTISFEAYDNESTSMKIGLLTITDDGIMQYEWDNNGVILTETGTIKEICQQLKIPNPAANAWYV